MSYDQYLQQTNSIRGKSSYSDYANYYQAEQAKIKAAKEQAQTGEPSVYDTEGIKARIIKGDSLSWNDPTQPLPPGWRYASARDIQQTQTAINAEQAKYERERATTKAQKYATEKTALETKKQETYNKLFPQTTQETFNVSKEDFAKIKAAQDKGYYTRVNREGETPFFEMSSEPFKDTLYNPAAIALAQKVSDFNRYNELFAKQTKYYSLKSDSGKTIRGTEKALNILYETREKPTFKEAQLRERINVLAARGEDYQTLRPMIQKAYKWESPLFTMTETRTINGKEYNKKFTGTERALTILGEVRQKELLEKDNRYISQPLTKEELYMLQKPTTKAQDFAEKWYSGIEKRQADMQYTKIAGKTASFISFGGWKEPSKERSGFGRFAQTIALAPTYMLTPQGYASTGEIVALAAEKTAFAVYSSFAFGSIATERELISSAKQVPPAVGITKTAEGKIKLEPEFYGIATIAAAAATYAASKRYFEVKAAEKVTLQTALVSNKQNYKIQSRIAEPYELTLKPGMAKVDLYKQLNIMREPTPSVAVSKFHGTTISGQRANIGIVRVGNRQYTTLTTSTRTALTNELFSGRKIYSTTKVLTASGRILSISKSTYSTRGAPSSDLIASRELPMQKAGIKSQFETISKKSELRAFDDTFKIDKNTYGNIKGETFQTSTTKGYFQATNIVKEQQSFQIKVYENPFDFIERYPSADRFYKVPYTKPTTEYIETGIKFGQGFKSPPTFIKIDKVYSNVNSAGVVRKIQNVPELYKSSVQGGGVLYSGIYTRTETASIFTYTRATPDISQTFPLRSWGKGGSVAVSQTKNTYNYVLPSSLVSPGQLSTYNPVMSSISSISRPLAATKQNYPFIYSSSSISPTTQATSINKAYSDYEISETKRKTNINLSPIQQGKTNLFSQPKTNLNTDMINLMKTTPKTETTTNIKAEQRTEQRTNIITKQIIDTELRQQTDLRITTDLTTNRITKTPTPPGLTRKPFYDTIPFIEGGFLGLDFPYFPSKKKKKKRKDLFNFGYTPSIEGVIFGIKGKAPSFVSGIEVRPMIATRKKKKQKVRKK